MKSETIKRKEAAKEAKYVAILDAAEAVLQKDGLEGLSINKVAKEAKIAKGTVYLYFESKEEIIGGLTIRARLTLLEYFKTYCGKQDDPIEKIKQIFWADYYFFKEKYSFHQLVTFYEQNTGLKESGDLAQASHNISVFIKDIIDEAKTKKVIRQDVDGNIQGFVFWGITVGILQIIETKGEQLEAYLGKSEKEFYTYFVNTTISSLMP